MNFASEKGDWKFFFFEKSHPTIALNVWYAIKILYLAYVSKNNLKHGKQVTALMILKWEVWCYITVKYYQNY